MDVLATDLQVFLDQWGHVGLAGAYYDMVAAHSVNDGIWWTVDWTQGGRETVLKYLGQMDDPRYQSGTGKFYALSAQYDFSLANLLWHPQPFDGRGADVRVAIAGLYHNTMETENPKFQNSKGYQFGLDVEYRMLPFLSATLRSYGTFRNPSIRTNSNTGTSATGNAIIAAPGVAGLYRTVTVTPGLIFRSDWQAPERIEIAYSRLFYSDFVDANPMMPLDQDVLTVGASVSF
jgi:hypothetical protein